MVLLTVPGLQVFARHAVGFSEGGIPLTKVIIQNFLFDPCRYWPSRTEDVLGHCVVWATGAMLINLNILVNPVRYQICVTARFVSDLIFLPHKA